MPRISLSLCFVLAFTAPSRANDCWLLQESFGADPSFNFGYRIALEGDTLIVLDEQGSLGSPVYSRGATGWILEDSLITSVPIAYSGESHDLVLQGDVALLGDARNSMMGSTVGAVFVFERNGGAWAEQTILTPNDAQTSSFFGKHVAMDGDRIAVSATFNESVYVFEKQGSSWVQTQKISDPEGRATRALVLEGDTLVYTTSNKARVYTHDGTSWVFQQDLPYQSIQTLFREPSVALEGGWLAVGVSGTSSTDEVRVYQEVAGSWELETTLSPSSRLNYRYGLSVSLDGTRLAVGATDEVGGLSTAGAVFLYELLGNVWTEVAVVEAPPGPVHWSGVGRFGESVILDDDRLLVGDPDGLSPSGSFRGAAYLFESDALFQPTVSFRNAGSNPVSFSASEARIGETLTFTASPFVTGHDQALVIGFDSPASITLSGGQVLLCLDLGGNGELVNTGFQSGPFASFDLVVPYVNSLVGSVVCTQAIHAFGTPGFALSNAQDLRIGPPEAACR